MFGNKSPEQPTDLANQVQHSAEQATPLLERSTEQVSAMLKSGADTVLNTSRQLRNKALQASDCTVNYVKDEPVKAMLIAAATGAALMALLSLTSPKREHH